MKKFLSIILSAALVLSLAVCPAMALTNDEITNAHGDHWETISIVDLGGIVPILINIVSSGTYSCI